MFLSEDCVNVKLTVVTIQTKNCNNTGTNGTGIVSQINSPITT